MDRYRAIRADPQSVRNLAKAASKKEYDEKRRLAREAARNNDKFEKFPEFRKMAAKNLQPNLNFIPAREGFASGSRDASFGERHAALKGDSDGFDAPGEVDNSAEAFEKGMTITWTPGEKSSRKRGKEREDESDTATPKRSRKKEKEKPVKGVSRFGAGLEKGVPTEERDLTGSQRSGRTKRRSVDGLRSASKSTLRKS